MGILNVTPDSFSDGNTYFQLDQAISRGLQIASEGADILDIGGESSRPGALPVSEQEEIRRVIPVIRALRNQIQIPISIDTVKPAVAIEAINAGAALINDISGFNHPRMRDIAASADIDICVMHMQGTPQTMQINPSYSENIITSLLKWFDERIELLLKAGIKKERIIIDPGIGFGKTVADNLKIIHNLPQFKALGFRVLLGASRKSFMTVITGKSAKDLLHATLAMNTLAIENQIDIIRVHDVKEHRDAVNVIDRMYQESEKYSSLL